MQTFGIGCKTGPKQDKGKTGTRSTCRNGGRQESLAAATCFKAARKQACSSVLLVLHEINAACLPNQVASMMAWSAVPHVMLGYLRRLYTPFG